LLHTRGRRDLLRLAAGAASAWPAALPAQAPGRVYRIAIVHPSFSPEALRGHRSHTVFLAELGRLGYVEGGNLVVQRYSGEGRTDRYQELARQVAATAPDAVLSISARMTLGFKAVTSTISVVAVAADPLGFGLAASLARPGGNITGVVPDAGPDLAGKRLELLHEAVPGATRIFVLSLPVVGTDPRGAGASRGVRAAAARLHVTATYELLAPPVGEPEYRGAFADMAQRRANGLIVDDIAENGTYQGLIIALAREARLPALYPERTAVERGGLMSYGVAYDDLYRRAAQSMAQILGGAAAGEIPFYQATTFELALNRATAATLGLTLPPTLVALADAVIE
jgi:putative ABC transport system substrate-binding protein